MPDPDSKAPHLASLRQSLASRPAFRVLPAFDLMNRQLVRGMAGNRAEYQPMISPLVPDANPVTFAERLRAELGMTDLYLADLDGIEQRDPWWELYETLATRGFRLVIDAGIESPEQIRRLLGQGAHQVVIGLETTPSPAHLREWTSALSDREREGVLFSLDIKGGKSHGPHVAAWPAGLLEIATVVGEMGIGGIILMDLDAVGMGTGPRWSELLGQMAERLAFRERIVAGGVRSRGDLGLLEQQQATGAIVASILHWGEQASSTSTNS